MGRITTAAAVFLMFFVSTGCASRITPLNDRTRAKPRVENVAGVRACWLEFGRSGSFTASGLLVEHPEGRVLIDAGQSARFRDEISDYPFGARWYLGLVPGGLTPEVPARDVLKAAGADPDALTLFIPTHVHSDHVGGLMDLPDVPVLLTREEREHLEGAAEARPFNVIPVHGERIAQQVREVTFVDEPYELFPRHADVLGDGSVVIVPLQGHTPGSIGVFVNLPDRRVFLVGDAVNDREAMNELRGKAFYLARTDNDRPRADAVVAELAALQAQVPSLAIIPAHERDAWTDVFDAPGGCGSDRNEIQAEEEPWPTAGSRRCSPFPSSRLMEPFRGRRPPAASGRRRSGHHGASMPPDVYLRRPTAKDERQFLRQARLSTALHAPSITAPTTARDFRSFLKVARSRLGTWYLVCPFDSEAFAGVVILNPILGPPLMSAELGYYAFEPLAGRGYMTQAVQLVTEIALTTAGLQRVQAHIEPRNKRSKSLVERCGFKFEGLCRGFLEVRGSWRDHEQWAITRADWKRMGRRNNRTSRR